MEAVFITIHDLSLDARIKYCSESVEFILGYRPEEVRGKSCWEYFHPDEIPFARAIHGRGLDLEKAASLHYCRVKHKDGSWIGAECVFTVVYDVLVASTAIYQRDQKSERRAIDGSMVRRIFSSSPRDPRYHMLSYISSKFIQPFPPHLREPRAALVLNRFTRTSSIMFATKGVEQLFGLTARQLVGKSFYYMIAENCLGQAIHALESAKGNDSIAYLRFWYRDPTLPDIPPIQYDSEQESDSETDSDSRSASSQSSNASEYDASGVQDVPQIRIHRTLEIADDTDGHQRGDQESTDQEHLHGRHRQRDGGEEVPSRTSSGDNTDNNDSAHNPIFDRAEVLESDSSATSISQGGTPSPGAIELEAVVSCTSDGLVVVLRRANQMVPSTVSPTQPNFPDGLFATPWAKKPILPAHLDSATSAPNITYPAVTEPVESGFMSAIRDVAVFAWSLTGINGSLIEHGTGEPQGESVPPGGLPVWDPNAPVGQNDCHNGFSGGTHRPAAGQGEPTREAVTVAAQGQSNTNDSTSIFSHQAVGQDADAWKREPVMPDFKRPRKRAHSEVLGSSNGHGLEADEVEEINDRRKRRLNPVSTRKTSAS